MPQNRVDVGTDLSSPAYLKAVLADGPLAFYRLKEKAGTTVFDSSGNQHHGVYINRVLLGRPPLLKSDRTATSVSFPNGYAAEQATWNTQAVTAECWMRPTESDLQTWPRIINNAWTDHDGNGFMMWITAGTVAFNTGWLSVVAPFPMTANNVYHAVGTYSNATGATLYVNGLAVANEIPGALPNPSRGDSATTYIGVLNAVGRAGLTDYFQGDISDCAVYDHVLTPTQIARHYNIGANAQVTPRPPPTPSPPPPSPPPPTHPPAPLHYDAKTACINHTLYVNVLAGGVGEFETNGLNRKWWGRQRGNTLGGNQYSGFRTSWGRNQYDTYFGDSSDGLPGGHDPFYVGRDPSAPGAPQGVRIEAIPMPRDLAGNPKVGGAHWYSGVLDTPVQVRRGFFVARVRVPPPFPGMSPAFWMLTNNGTPQGTHGPLNGEWDIQEMFGNDLGNGMNAGTILWNSGASHNQAWGGVYSQPAWETKTPSQDYHDYGALVSPGGAPISNDDNGPGGPGYVYGDTREGVTNYLDGIPLYGHTGGGDVTSGVRWKELMAMFQVGPAGGWLGTPNPLQFPAYYWVQWIRAYRAIDSFC